MTKALTHTRHLLAALRPRHWVKNAVVVAAPLFALQLHTLPQVALAFVAFSMAASGFYLVNDLLDVEADRRHPVKRHRPIAAGLVPVPLATATAVLLLSGSLALSFAATFYLGVILAAYVVLQLAYNAGLKHEPILDIMGLAAGFVLRAMAGAAAAGVSVSGWFVLCVGLLAFFLGIEKRKAELKAVGDEHTTRTVLQHYSLSWLRRMESVVTAGALISYALWTLEGARTEWMLATLPFVAYGIFKYQYLTEQGEGETPERVLVKDPAMIATVVLWALLSLGLLAYGAQLPG